MRTSIYLPRGALVMAGHDLVPGVTTQAMLAIEEPCTLFVDDMTGEVVFDTNHTIPKGWKEVT